MNGRDVLKGFFGWFIFGNVIIIGLLLYVAFNGNLSSDELSIIPWLLTAAAGTILFIKRKFWIGAGVLGAVGFNALAWRLMLGSFVPELMGLPLPAGFLRLMG